MPLGNRSLSAGRFLSIMMLALVCIFLFAMRSEIVTWPNQSVYVMATFAAALSVIVVGMASRLQLWSGGFFLIVVIALFHMGLPLVFTMGWEVPYRYEGYLQLWLGQQVQVNAAVWLCVISMLMFALGYLIATTRTDNSTVLDRPQNGEGMAAGGLVITAVGVVMYLGFVAITAPDLLLGAGGKRLYEQVVAGSEPIAYGTILVSIGSVMAAAAPKSKTRTTALVVFGVFTLATLAFGSRTAALYSVVAIIVVIARVAPMPRKRVAVVVLVGGMMLVSGVQQVRDEGLSSASIVDFVGSPASAASEMGLTLRPVIETVGWVEGGERLRMGSTYIAGPIRVIEGLAGVDRVPSSEDERFAGYLVRSRVDLYQIGYSMIAEGYLNFGRIGVGLLFLALGFGLGRWDNTRHGNSLSAARYGVFFVALIALVRQASNITITSIVLGLLAIWGCRMVALAVRKRVPGAEGVRHFARI